MLRGEASWWYATRNELFNLLKKGWQGTLSDLAQCLQVSLKWVKKWKTRFKPHLDTNCEQLEVKLKELCLGYSCVPHQLREAAALDEVLQERIVHWRTSLLQKLGRVAGAKTISYFLSQDAVLAEQGIAPTSSITIIYRVLKQNHLVAPQALPKRAAHLPQVRALPMHTWELDFTDVPGRGRYPGRKKAQQQTPQSGGEDGIDEACNILDAGSSIVIASIVDTGFDAESITRTVALIFKEKGVPQVLRIDRDPRLVGGYAGQDYPAGFERMSYSLGVAKIEKCPPLRAVPTRKPLSRGFTACNARGRVF